MPRYSSSNNRRMRDRCARIQATYDNPEKYQPRIDAGRLLRCWSLAAL
jgi:hypothetical protein